MGDVRYQGSKEEDVAALLAVNHATNGRDWKIKWDLAADPRTWYGVEIGDEGGVVSLKLEYNNLQGKRPFSCSASRYTQTSLVQKLTRSSALTVATICVIRVI